MIWTTMNISTSAWGCWYSFSSEW